MPIHAVRSTVHHELDMPADRLAAVIGSWPQPALLESGPDFGEAGRWSILAARPRLVWEATGSHWCLRADNGTVENGEGDVVAILDRLLRRYALADPRTSLNRTFPCFREG